MSAAVMPDKPELRAVCNKRGNRLGTFIRDAEALTDIGRCRLLAGHDGDCVACSYGCCKLSLLTEADELWLSTLGAAREIEYKAREVEQARQDLARAEADLAQTVARLEQIR